MTKDETMKLALEALEFAAAQIYNEDNDDIIADAITALRQALDHVPDTTKMIEPDMGIDRGAWDDVPDATKWVDELRGGDETEQEPATLESVYEIIIHWDEGGGKRSRRELARRITELYTAPPKREWVGLTDEEIAEGAKQSWVDKQAFESVAWWAEEKLKDKNRG